MRKRKNDLLMEKFEKAQGEFSAAFALRFERHLQRLMEIKEKLKNLNPKKRMEVLLGHCWFV